MEVAADLTVEETAGVSGQVTAVNVLFMGGSTTIEGPGTFDQEVLQRFGVSTLRINARGTLTMREIGVHFSPGALDLLPGTLRFSVIFRDDNGHTITSAEAVIQVSR